LNELKNNKSVPMANGELMKKLFIIILTTLSFSAMARSVPEKIMDCEALGTQNQEVIFDLKAEIYNSKVSLQGTTITSTQGGIVKTASLTLTSKDKFEDHFDISILVKHGDRVIESETLKDLSLNRGTRIFGITKKLPNYEMSVTCTKI
jgi:hypothetical protein